MEKSGPVSRDFPSGESSSVLQTIKVEETSAEEGADRTQSEFPYGMERHSGGGIDRREDLNSACDRSAMSMEKSSDNHGNVGGMGPPRTVPRRSSQPRLVDHSVSSQKQPGTQGSDCLGIPLVIGRETFERWQQAGSAEGLASDSDIAAFLLNLYEASSSKNKALEETHLCSTCQTPLTLVCLTCNPAQAKHEGVSTRTRSSASALRRRYVPDDADDDDDTNDVEPLTVATEEKKENVEAPAVEDVAKNSGTGDSILTEDTFMKALNIASKKAVETLKQDEVKAVENKTRKVRSLKIKMKPGRKPKAAPAAVKRKPGRPRKNPETPPPPKKPEVEVKNEEEESTPAKNEEEESTPAKRKRGRPKKEPFPVLLENGEVDEKPFKCSVCFKGFKDRSNCRVHELNHTQAGKRHKCDQCPAAFRSPANLKAHIRKHTGEKPFCCEVCGRAFARTTTLKEHMRTHSEERPYKCEQCGEAFKQRGLLTVHIRKKHTFERPFGCNLCGATFVVKGHLKVHMQCHTGLRPYLCDECGASFKMKGILKTHKMIHRGIRPHSCDICNKAFYREVDVRVHKRKIHLNIRNVICTVCGSAFGSNSTLKRHMQTHTGFRPYKCSDCGKNFASNSELKVHIRIHTGHKPYACDVCGRGFQTMGNMKKHRANRHKHAPPYVPPPPSKAREQVEKPAEPTVSGVNLDLSRKEAVPPLPLQTVNPPPMPFHSTSQGYEAFAPVAHMRPDMPAFFGFREKSHPSFAQGVHPFPPQEQIRPYMSSPQPVEQFSSDGEV